MSQISEFFGLQARIVRELDTKDYSSFTSLFMQWLNKNPEVKATNPHLYIHKMIFDITPRHFMVTGIENRIGSLDVSVKVNRKQESNGAIKFINHKIGHRLTPSVGHTFGNYKNTYFINGNQFTNTHFEEYLATVVMQRLSLKDRKVKFILSAQPLPSYGPRLRNVPIPVITKIDFHLNKDVQLSLPF